MFDLLVILGSVDLGLVKQCESLLNKEDLKEDFDAVLYIEEKLHFKYKGELFGILCQLTGGEAKNVIKGISDSAGYSGGGFKALWMLKKRFDSKTFSSILGACFDVVKPTPHKECE